MLLVGTNNSHFMKKGNVVAENYIKYKLLYFGTCNFDQICTEVNMHRFLSKII